MPAFAPRNVLATHEVTNQPGEFVDVNLYAIDTPLREAVAREAGDWLHEPLMRLGADAGSERVLELGAQANRYPPELVQFDRFGRRIDEARFHPAYHELMALAMDHGVHDLAWRADGRGRHVAHAAMLALFTQAEAGVMCPMNMTYAVVPALRRDEALTRPWLERIIGGTYDPKLRPVRDKRGVTMGMAMTEKQGGSDVRANATGAFPLDGGRRSFRLVGHKWFCSAPMCDGFLTLAYTDRGLSCFLVPRITENGERNAIHVMRLKDKLGNRSNASSEIEYHDAFAWLLGEEGRGVNVIIDMVHHTRLGTIAGTTGMMHMALAHALHHTRNRRAFQKNLADQPVMATVLADLALEYEAAVALTMRVARAFDATEGEERAFARLAVAVAKYWLTKRNSNFVYECMECHGGAGYVEESIMPRLFREAPLNAIWEGSGNVIALDIMRTLAREPLALDAFASELARARGADGAFDAAADALLADLRAGYPERDARIMAERMALLLQAALLMTGAPNAVADAFVVTRVRDQAGRTFGTLPKGVDEKAILARHPTA
ncbi:acyl-CoA dehydrogenase family protein [Camelimonas abortus]|uniref:Acyl-CoA dehydrogenase family protein n=1 Tax=Camelimonas abortus TaxID=1017184 RepID=A0ABV7LAI7_9HYPH